MGQGKTEANPAGHPLALGSPIRLQVWFRHGWLGPYWAALCGGITSGALTLSAAPIMRLALLIFLVEVVWGGLWSALAATDWATPLRRWQHWRHSSPKRVLPYASPYGPAGRLASAYGQLQSWWRDSARPALGPTLAGLILLIPSALVISGALGVGPLMTTLLAITVLQFVFLRTGGDARPTPGPQGLFEIALPWVAGHVLFSPLSLTSLTLALAFGLSYAGGLRMAQAQAGLARWNIGQIVSVVLVVILRQPVAAGMIGIFIVAQAIPQPALVDAEAEEIDPNAAVRFLRWTQPWLMATMLVAAWGVSAAVAAG